MSIWDRRKALRLFPIAMLASAGASLLPARLLAAQPLIQPPEGPMHYSRRLISDLSGGASIAVFRKYEVMFGRFSDGFLIEGRQIEVSVDAPDSIREFAELERSRMEEGLFPIVIDPFGMLLDNAGAPAQSESVDEAVSIAGDMIAKADMGDTRRAEVSSLVASIDEATIAFTAYLPPDLFCPPTTERIADEAVQLAGGESGRVTTRFGGTRDKATGLMENASRSVVTEIGDDRRQVREEWELRKT